MFNRRVTGIALLLGLIVALAPAGPAVGQAAGIADPDDTSGSLDVRQISYMAKYGDDNQVVAYTFIVRTYDRWRCRYLKQGNATKLTLKWDDRGDDPADLVGRFRCVQGKLIFLLSSTAGDQFEPLPAKHPTRKRASVTVPEAAFKGAFLMWGRSYDAKAVDCATACLDRAPDEGRF